MEGFLGGPCPCSRVKGYSPLLVEQVVDTPGLKEEIGKLIGAKRRGEELDRGPRIAAISEFIESELARLENKRFDQEYYRPRAPVDEFNDLFRSALDEVWSSS
jgi:predicted nucleotidyltransferase